MTFAGLLLLIAFTQCHSIKVERATHKGDDKYFWPSGRGRVGSYSVSPFVAPSNSKESLAWTWHDPVGRYRNVPNGANIDGQKNIYLTSLDGIRKFSPDGNLLWTFHGEKEMPDQASLYNGAVYVSATQGTIYAISMETGQALWETKLKSTDGNNGWVSVSEDTVITGSDNSEMYHGHWRAGKNADQLVTGLNATDGTVKWRYTPTSPVWNFAASFAGDGTFIFQDYEGRAYRNRVSDGTNLWQNGGAEGSWTDGGALMGSNNIVYSVGMIEHSEGNSPGYVYAFALEDGKQLWKTRVPRPPNNVPGLGRLAGKTGLSLVQPIGQQCQMGQPTDVYALDAETGEVQWVFNGPTQKNDLQAGDSNPIARHQREMAGVRQITLPNPWSAPTIDGAGKVFIGSEEGPFYALVDTNGDGHVEGPDEVSSFDTFACFSGSSSAAHAPGMMVAASIDAMYVFKQ